MRASVEIRMRPTRFAFLVDPNNSEQLGECDSDDSPGKGLFSDHRALQKDSGGLECSIDS